jgi:hypothetical protein
MRGTRSRRFDPAVAATEAARVPAARAALRGAVAALLMAGAGAAAAQQDLSWGIEERASEGCIQEVSLAFDAPGVLGGHGPRTLCGATPVRLYPAPPPSRTLSVFWKDQQGRTHRHDVPLDSVLRREQLRMEGTVLEIVYGQEAMELWARPLSAPAPVAGETPADGVRAAARQRIFFGGLQVLPGQPVQPGLHRSR